MDPVVAQVPPTLSCPWPQPEKVVLPRVFDSFWETIRNHFFWQAALCTKCRFPMLFEGFCMVPGRYVFSGRSSSITC